MKEFRHKQRFSCKPPPKTIAQNSLRRCGSIWNVASLMNAVIGRELVPTGVLPVTSAVTILRFCPLHTWQLADLSSIQGLAVGYPKLLEHLARDFAGLAASSHDTSDPLAALREMPRLAECAIFCKSHSRSMLPGWQPLLLIQSVARRMQRPRERACVTWSCCCERPRTLK